MKDQPAFPLPYPEMVGGEYFKSPGLTKRELFAAMAMQGLCANPSVLALTDDNCVATMLPIEQFALGVADHLLAELEGDKK